MTREVAATTKPEPTVKIGRKLPDVKPLILVSLLMGIFWIGSTGMPTIR